MGPKSVIRQIARSAGYEIKRVARDPFYERRHRVLTAQGIHNVIDVGANVGQYGRGLRSAGYSGHITSFEPLPTAFIELTAAAANDPAWVVHNEALGSSEGRIPFHVSDDGVCSSALTPTATLTNAIPEAVTLANIEVPVRRLDGITIKDPIMLKIDTQGFEREVLDGAAEVMDKVRVIDLELAFAELYEGGSSAYSLLPHLRDLGFVIHCVDEGYTDPTSGQTLDADFLMTRV